MQRYLTLLVLVLLTAPIGLSIQGCANKNADFCNGAGFGYTTTQAVSITMGPQITGISLAYGQIGRLDPPSALTCKGTSATIETYTYGTTNRTIADVSPTGQVCGGTWNLNTPGVANYTTCVPTSNPGVAYLTAQADGFTSNQVAVYSHAPITTLNVNGPVTTNSTTGQQTPACLSQGQTTQLDATASCISTGLTGQCPSPASPTNSNVPLVPAGQSLQMCSPSYTVTASGPVYGPTDCNNVIGHITYTTPSNNIVTINQTGVATAQLPGSTLIYGSLSNSGSTSGYFYTCSPQSIALSLTATGSTTGTLTPNNPQPLTATVTDVHGVVINGLNLTYVSTNPGSIAVSSTGSVTSSFPSSSTITALCEPGTCNPAPINVIGTLGSGAPIISNSVQVSSPGENSTLVWLASPNSPYFVPIDLSTGTAGTRIKLPYTPNSMVMDQGGNNLYFGSYRELMIYSAPTNALVTQDTTVPGVVLAVSPDNTKVLINDQQRGVLYVYTPASSGTSSTGTATAATAASVTSFAGIGEHAVFTPDSQTVYVVGQNVLYIYNTYTGWSVENLPAGQGAPTTGTCPVNNSSSQPNDPTSDPPDTPTNPNNEYNTFCSPDLAVTVPSAAVFLSGTSTSAYSVCPQTAITPVVNYPEAAVVAATADQIAATTDGKHILGATANPPTLTDISVNVPINACPTATSSAGVQQTSGNTFTPAPTFPAPISLAAYGISNVDQVVASTNSSQAFITYSSNATAPPPGGALLPVYMPAAQPGNAGTIANVTLAGNAIAPISGIFSPDNSLIMVSTTGDDLLHLINSSKLTDTQQINPGLIDINENPVAAVFLAVKPRPITGASTN